MVEEPALIKKRMQPARSHFSYSSETEEIKESLGLATKFL